MATDVSEFMLRLTSNWQLSAAPDGAAQAPSLHRREHCTPTLNLDAIVSLN